MQYLVIFSLYRKCVGKLQWVVPLRPDIAFATKELARHLNEPNYENVGKLKHLLRYLRGTLHYKLRLQPRLTLDSTLSNDLEIDE